MTARLCLLTTLSASMIAVGPALVRLMIRVWKELTN